MTASRPILSVRGLTVQIDEEPKPFLAVDDVSLDVMRGQTVAVVGQSGSGKTLTALSLIGLLPTPPAKVVSGEVEFHGRDLLRLGERELCRLRGSQMAMVFQEPATSLNPVMPVGRQIAEVIQLHKKLGRRSAREQVLALMEMVGIPDPRRRYNAFPHQLSGGTRQRVVIAIALACRPDLVLADEPTTALDPTVQAQILDLLSRLISDLQMSVLLITHDLGVVAYLADRVVVLHQGRIVEQGSVAEILEDPLHPYTRALLGARLSSQEKGPESGLASLGGRVASGTRGCPFGKLCPSRIEDCLTVKPAMVDLGSGRSVRCFLQEKVDVGG